uniref:NADH-ubiquinone oxidoreductase chain 3 n=1 Tax=Trichobilharzia szidati TaxID=157070 RepID=A0A343QZ19_9TREM|nr:NADH dehydrogenase subunit 3 [Trichobilharzia szidati]ATV95732.1 NADH dehydrogenase subunit 3 [Trichobilharzia szidati]
MFYGFLLVSLLVGFMFFLLLYYLYGGWGYKSILCGGDRVWISSFECGFISQGFGENLFSYTFLNLLVIFVVFDLEISLLLNLPFQGVWYDNYYCYLFFIFLVVVGYSFELEKGYVEWSF